MKYILLLFALIMALNVSAQKPKNTTTIANDAYGYVFGAAKDTIAASDTLYYKIRLTSNYSPDINWCLQMTKTSGTVTNTWYFYGSMIDSWTVTDAVAIDTITLTGASSGYTNLTTAQRARWVKYRFPYIIVKGIAGATAQRAKYKLFYLTRFD